MPLCDVCKSQAHVQPPTPTIKHSNPPHGMEWGESCDRCDRKAEITVK